MFSWFQTVKVYNNLRSFLHKWSKIQHNIQTSIQPLHWYKRFRQDLKQGITVVDSFRNTGTMGTLASQAEIGAWVQAQGRFCECPGDCI